MTTSRLRNPINRSPWRRAFFLIPLMLALAWFALPPRAQAVTPAPDGGYSGQNTAEGTNALFSLTTGIENTAMGFKALYSNTTGIFNTANGANALLKNTTGDNNTANGVAALVSNTTGYSNTANGVYALSSNTTGFWNAADGAHALYHNTSGHDNTANGGNALFSNTTGHHNTANGVSALVTNITGHDNTANGGYALADNYSGSFNTANGGSALFSNTTGISNTAAGNYALFKNTSGFNNTANGVNALYYNTTGSNNIALGFSAGVNLTTGSNNIDIGNYGVAGEANTIRIGTVGTQTATFIAGISGKTAAGGIPVIVNANGKLGTTVSSARFKEAIKPMDKASEAIHALKPVTFRYKQELDPESIPQFGLVAEEVEKVNPDLVVRDADGKVYTVRYDAVNAMLLNEFLKEHRKVTQLETTVAQQQKKFESKIADQQKEIEALTTSLKEQASQIQKVSAELELRRPAPQTALNNQ
jgi:trimeric autotransporter adhesin